MIEALDILFITLLFKWSVIICSSLFLLGFLTRAIRNL